MVSLALLDLWCGDNEDASLDSWRGELTAGEDDLRKCKLATPVISLFDDVDSMEQLRESRGRVSDLLSLRLAEYCNAALVLSWMFTVLLCLSSSSDFLFSLSFSSPATEQGRVENLVPTEPVEIDRLGALFGRPLLCVCPVAYGKSAWISASFPPEVGGGSLAREPKEGSAINFGSPKF